MAPARADAPMSLEDVVVADFSRVLAGPFATMLLGDLGADVLKIERPGSGDDTRRWGPPFVEGESAYFLAVNRNKRSIALDLGTPEGIAAARAVVASADVLVENFKPGTMERLGLGYEALAAEHPGLVYCSISGFGTEGPGAALLGYDFLVQASGGLMSITGEEGGEGLKVGVAVADVLTGLFASNAVLAALVHRGATGEGQHVEVNLLSSVLAGLVNQASTFLTTGTVPKALGNRHPTIAPYESFRASDRPVVVAVGNDGQFAAMAAELGLDGLASDERFATNSARVEHRDELAARLETRIATELAADLVDRLQRAGVPAALVNDVGEAFAYAESVGLEPVVQVADPDGGRPVAQVASPLTLSAAPVRYRRRPPALGEHTDEVLKALGLG